jgi:Zn-dependent M28 family amino/carboxypeptidase
MEAVMRLAPVLSVLPFLVTALHPARGLTGDDLVADVSQSNLGLHIAALEGERATEAQQAAAAAYIRSQLESYGYEVTSDPVLTSENLIARISGIVHPDQTFILGAHFDSVVGSPGADDNASGVAGMLEIARILAGLSFESSIELVSFGLEEVGLRGSRQFAETARAAGRNLIGMISLELIGYTCDFPFCQYPFRDRTSCFDVSTEDVNVGTYIAGVANAASVGLLGAFEVAAATYVPNLRVESAIVEGVGLCFPDTRRSDHAPFWDHGYAALMLTDTANFRNPNYHQPTDTLETLDLEFATDVTRAALATVVTSAVLVPEPSASLLTASLLLALAGLARLGRVGRRPA